MENLNFDVNYNEIEAQEVFVDDSDKVITQKELNITPFDVIKATAQQLGQEIVDPTPGCKHCLGRGYIGRNADSKAPIPCSCIQPGFNSIENTTMYNRTKKLSRAERRQLDRENKKRVKRGTI